MDVLESVKSARKLKAVQELNKWGAEILYSDKRDKVKYDDETDYENWGKHVDLLSDDIDQTLLEGFEKIGVGDD